MAKGRKTNIVEKSVSDIIEENVETIYVEDIKKSENKVKLDDSFQVKVRSNVMGELIYINSRTGDETRWSKCGEIQILSLADLRAMKATQISFFKNQWIIIIGYADEFETKASCADIYNMLGIAQYYKEFVDPADYKSIIGWTKDQIKEKVSMLNDGAKQNMKVAINEFIERGILDSLQKINAFGEALGCTFELPR